ncbi:hypothetical protein HON01_07265 [Candidatus Woesearchaeota archaeon]|nr:hypothetical protein [Candidatus Woesearchaeota archaeon]
MIQTQTHQNFGLKKLNGIKPKGIKVKKASLTEKILQASDFFTLIPLGLMPFSFFNPKFWCVCVCIIFV